jgi:hypothetical protein
LSIVVNAEDLLERDHLAARAAHGAVRRQAGRKLQPALFLLPFLGLRLRLALGRRLDVRLERALGAPSLALGGLALPLVLGDQALELGAIADEAIRAALQRLDRLGVVPPQLGVVPEVAHEIARGAYRDS